MTIIEAVLPEKIMYSMGIPSFGAFPAIAPTKHQLIPTITMAAIPKNGVLRNSTI
jgi:hypothetical protein